MNTLLQIIILFSVSAAVASPAPSMYADRIARSVGDVVTVLIVENSSASATARTNTKSEFDASAEAAGTGALDFIPLLSGEASASAEHKGDGRTVRQGTFRGTITANVIEVLPNGYLKIEGEKSVVINGEKQVTVLSGVVRPDDISPENAVRSDVIANAEITYKGKGVLGSAERPGVISRFLNWLF